MMRTSIVWVAVLAAAAAALPRASAQSTWIGQTVSVSPQGNNVSIVGLNADGSIQKVLSTIAIGTETVSTDTFRCVPLGAFCYFLTTDAGGGSSYLYNVSDVTGRDLSRVTLPGLLAQTLHINMANGAAYSVALNAGGSGGAIVSVLGGVVSTLVDLSKYLTRGSVVHRGSSTQCSDDNLMWVCIGGAAGANGVLVTAALDNTTVLAVTQLAFPQWDAMWAYCDDQTDVNSVGGTVLQVSATGERTLVYGDLGAGGTFVPGPSVVLPASTPALAPSGLLSMPDNFDFFAGVYPAGAVPGSTVAGYLALFNTQGPMTLQPISYFLSGAARYK
jgi:hypothetical protein